MKNPLPVVFSIHVRAAFQDGPGDIEEDEEDENKEQRVLQSGRGDTAAGSGVRFSEGLYLRQLFAENADNRHHRCDSCRRYDSPGDEGRRRRQERRMTHHGSGEDRKVHRGAEKGKEDDPVAAGREAGSQLQGCQQMGDRSESAGPFPLQTSLRYAGHYIDGAFQRRADRGKRDGTEGGPGHQRCDGRDEA